MTNTHSFLSAETEAAHREAAHVSAWSILGRLRQSLEAFIAHVDTVSASDYGNGTAAQLLESIAFAAARAAEESAPVARDLGHEDGAEELAALGQAIAGALPSSATPPEVNGARRAETDEAAGLFGPEPRPQPWAPDAEHKKYIVRMAQGLVYPTRDLDAAEAVGRIIEGATPQQVSALEDLLGHIETRFNGE